MCGVPLCKTSKDECWDLHILNGLPEKQYLKRLQVM